MEKLPLSTVEEHRSAYDNILRKHFGSEVIEEILEGYGAKIAGHPPINISDGLSIGLFVLLQRSGDE